jgi:hypothetical protein
VQLVFTLLNLACKKCSCHLILNMCIAYFCIILFLLLSLVFSLLSVATSTICTYHLTLLENLPTQNFTIATTKVSISPATIEAILECPPGLNATNDNNFINILGIESLFNVTKEVGAATSQITSAQGAFNPNTQIQAAINQLASVSNSTSFNISKTAPVSSFQNQITTFRNNLPAYNMNRTNVAQQNKLQTYYLSSVQVNSQTFSWVDYQAAINNVNNVMATASNIPSGYYKNYTFASIVHFTQSSINTASSPFNSGYTGTSPPAVTYGSGGNYNNLLTYLGVTDAYTAVVSGAITANNQVLTNLTIIGNYVNNVATSVNTISSIQTSLSTLQSGINSTLYDILGEADTIIKGLTTQANSVNGIAQFVLTAPQYTKCGFIGDFYAHGFQDTICVKLNQSLKSGWIFMAFAAFALLVTFITFSRHVRKPDWYLNPEESDEPGIQLTPARTAALSPKPAAGNSLVALSPRTAHLA